MKIPVVVAVVGLVVIALLAITYIPIIDVAGQGTHTEVSGTSREVQTVMERQFSAEPVDLPIFAYPYFTEKDYIKADVYTDYSNGTSRLESTRYYWTMEYPVTPKMVSLNPSQYPNYIVDYYKTNFPEFFGPLSIFSLRISTSITRIGANIESSDVITWEAVMA